MSNKMIDVLVETFRDALHRGKQPTFSAGDLKHFINELLVLRTQVAERDAMLREARGCVQDSASNADCAANQRLYISLLNEIDAALSASAEPKCCAPTAEELKLLADGDCTPEELWGIGGKPSCLKCHKAEPSAPVTAWDHAAPGTESYTVGAKP